MRHLIITLLVTFITVTALAQTGGCIYIEDFEIAPDSTIAVPVMLTNAEATQGLQFNMYLPDGLILEEIELTKYSRRLKMNVVDNRKDDRWIVAVYSMSQTTFPPDTAAVLTLTLTASPDFQGGDITIKKSQGSSLDFSTIYYDDSSTTVTPALGQWISPLNL